MDQSVAGTPPTLVSTIDYSASNTVLLEEEDGSRVLAQKGVCLTKLHSPLALLRVVVYLLVRAPHETSALLCSAAHLKRNPVVTSLHRLGSINVRGSWTVFSWPLVLSPWSQGETLS